MNIQVEFLNEVPEAPPPAPSLLKRFGKRIWFHTKRSVMPAHGTMEEILRMYSFIWIIFITHALLILLTIVLVTIDVLIKSW